MRTDELEPRPSMFGPVIRDVLSYQVKACPMGALQQYKGRAMAEIFLSYAKEDREPARRIAKVLESCGWSVFWDR